MVNSVSFKFYAFVFLFSRLCLGFKKIITHKDTRKEKTLTSVADWMLKEAVSCCLLES